MQDKTCRNCKNFYCYRDMYEDDLEPSDFGECEISKECISEDDSCDKFEAINNAG